MSQIEAFTEAQGLAIMGDFVELLRDSVSNGASIGFVLPLATDVAEGFWRDVFRDVSKQSRILLVARQDGRVVGSVQLGLCLRPNGLHRAEVQKLLVHTAFRRRGVARALMAAIERAARAANRTLLVLDTEPGKPAERLYELSGWSKAGTIPGYAATPEGELHGTTFFYKQLIRLLFFQLRSKSV